VAKFGANAVALSALAFVRMHFIITHRVTLVVVVDWVVETLHAIPLEASDEEG
jgi:hypothetical protein